MPFTILDGGSFASTGAAVKIILPSSADYFRTWNITKLSASGTFAVGGEWFGAKFLTGQSAANDGIRERKAGSNSILKDAFSNSSGTTAGGGFTYITTSPQVEAAVAVTSVTAASPAVVTATNTYSEGDIVRWYGTAGMLQYGGITAQISTVSSAGYTLIGIRAAGLTAGTGGFTRRISKFNAVEPEYLYVTEITKATQAVVRCSVDPSPYYVVGMKVHFSVPSSFGMTEMDQRTGTITAISAANYTMTVDIDSSAFTTFAFPLTTLSAQLFATVAPAGAKTAQDPNTLVYTGYNFNIQPFHTGQFTPYMYLGSDGSGTPGTFSPVGASGDVINWMAYKLEV